MEQIYLNIRASGERTELGNYYRYIYPSALIARYLWPSSSSSSSSSSSAGDGNGNGIPPRRILQTQYAHKKYSKYLEPQELAPTADGLHQLLAYRKPYSLHMGVLAARGQYLKASDTYTFELQHELLIDLDVRDWEVQRPGTRSRLCACGNDQVCGACWTLVMLAAAVCRAWIGEELGLGPMLVVYSGGKGAHFHFATRQARCLTSRQRHHLAHQMADAEGAVRAAIAHETDPRAPRWRIGEAVLAAAERIAPSVLARMALPSAATSSRAERLSALLRFAWPVADMAVVNDPGQLKTIKVPFSVHAKTQRLALPLPADSGDMCDPAVMPTVEQLLGQRHAQHAQAEALWQAALSRMAAWLDAIG